MTGNMPLSRAARLALASVCLLGIVLAAPGLTDESHVSLDGDMPRYLMNAAFLHDLARDFPLQAAADG